MTEPRRSSHGRSTALWKRLRSQVLVEERFVCWLCDMPGADTVDHVIPLAERPDLAYVRWNLRAAHGRKHTLESDGWDCPGNYGRGGWSPVDNTSEEW